MAGGWPIGVDICNATDQGTVTSGASSGTTVTASASTNTLGSWTQIVASTAIDACFIIVSVDGSPSTGQGNAVDIGIGAGGSEQVLISAIQVMGNGTLLPGNLSQLAFPCQIPAGTRIAARVQSTVGSSAVAVQVILIDGAFTQWEGGSIVDTYGNVTSTSVGTAVDPGGTIGTKGSYAQLTASTSYDLMGFMLCFDHQAFSNGQHGPDNWLIDIAIGASGSEVVIYPNLPMTMNCQSGEPNALSPVATEFIPITIAAGTRIAARCMAGTATASYRIVGVTLYGVRL